MLKRDELSNPTSCLNKANDDEIIFVLLERDDSFIDAVRAWIESRIRKGKNVRGDSKIVNAEQMIKEVSAGKQP